MKRQIRLDPLIRFFIILIGIILLAITLKELQHIFLPFVIAYVLYFLFAPLNNFLSEKKVPAFFIVLLNLVIMLSISFGSIQVILQSVDQFTQDLPEYFTKLNIIVRDLAKQTGIKDPYFRNFSIQKIIQKLDYKELAGGAFSSALYLSGAVLLLIFFFGFIVTGHEAVYNAIKRRYVSREIKPMLRSIEAKYGTQDLITEDLPALEDKLEEERHLSEVKLENTVKQITIQIQKYIISKTALNFGAAVIIGLMLYFIGLDFSLIWGVFVFILNFIPTIGSAIALILPTLMALVQFESLGFSLLTASLIALVQTLFFNVLEPIVLGKRLGLNPIVILLSVLIWGYIWGIPGMLLAVPLTAILKIVLSNSRSQNVKFIVDLMDQD